MEILTIIKTIEIFIVNKHICFNNTLVNILCCTVVFNILYTAHKTYTASIVTTNSL